MRNIGDIRKYCYLAESAKEGFRVFPVATRAAEAARTLDKSPDRICIRFRLVPFDSHEWSSAGLQVCFPVVVTLNAVPKRTASAGSGAQE